MSLQLIGEDEELSPSSHASLIESLRASGVSMPWDDVLPPEPELIERLQEIIADAAALLRLVDRTEAMMTGRSARGDET